MKLREIKQQLKEERQKLKLVIEKHTEISKTISKLIQQSNDIVMQYFVDYLEIGSKWTFHQYSFPSGVVVIKQHNWPTTFSSGDVIEIVKKNQKSIVIKLIKKFSKPGESPNCLYRIELKSFKDMMTRSTNFGNSFNTWILRQNALDDILD